jgi:type 1 glutamine amidotransferase
MTAMNRRQILLAAGASAASLALSALGQGWAKAADQRRRRVLMYTKSEEYEHAVVKRPAGGGLALAEQIVTELGQKHGFDVHCTKDGREFVNEDLGKFDGFLFETQGDILKGGGVDGQPGMPVEGKRAFLKAVADGKGFVGCHCASDTFHSAGSRTQAQEQSRLDPYLAMLGGEFIRHGKQQKARLRVVDPRFPGVHDVHDLQLLEEWYSLKNFAPDLHVILVQETSGMEGSEYERPAFPATWARRHHHGRVFYTSMGHREDVWQNPLFQQILLGAISWSVGNVDAELRPNLREVAPEASVLPPPPPAKPS